MSDENNMAKPEASRPSPRFNAIDADVYFKSADNCRFGIHRKNLEVATGAFPPSDFSTQGETVLLSESAETLELMFQYIYPMPQPDISLLPFETLASLAEAAEKYQVFPAMFVCKTYMQKFIPEHAQEILGYAAKHGYNDLVGEAAPLLLVKPWEESLLQLPANLVIPWALYRGAWDRVLLQARSFHLDPELEKLAGAPHNRYVGPFGDPHPCINIDKALCEVLKKLNDLQSLQSLADVFKPNTACEHITPHLDSWREKIEGEVRAIRPFVTYL